MRMMDSWYQHLDNANGDQHRMNYAPKKWIIRI